MGYTLLHERRLPLDSRVTVISWKQSTGLPLARDSGPHLDQELSAAQNMPDTRILNITRGFRLKPSQAYRGIEEGAFAWVALGETVRDMTLAETYAFRVAQIAPIEPLANAEIPGLIFSGKRNMDLVRQAHEFCTQQTA